MSQQQLFSDPEIDDATIDRARDLATRTGRSMAVIRSYPRGFTVCETLTAGELALLTVAPGEALTQRGHRARQEKTPLRKEVRPRRARHDT
jgi:hypothetical protein